MTGPSHLIIGILAYVKLAQLIPALVPPVTESNTTLGLGVAAGLAAVAALLPDIDQPNATITQLTIGRIGKTRIRPLLPVSYLMARLAGGHRKGTHTLFITSAFWIIAFAITTGAILTPAALTLGYAMLAVAIGYTSHILADMATPTGCPVLLPFSERNFHVMPRFLRVTTGSVSEYVLVLFILLLASDAYKYVFALTGTLN